MGEVQVSYDRTKRMTKIVTTAHKWKVYENGIGVVRTRSRPVNESDNKFRLVKSRSGRRGDYVSHRVIHRDGDVLRVGTSAILRR